MILDNIYINSYKDTILRYFENIKKGNFGTYLSSNNLVVNLLVIYIIYVFTKDLIKGLITAILYTAVITITIMYAYKYINSTEQK